MQVNQTNKDLSDYRLERAADCLDTAKKMVELGKYRDATNRSYYCIFHCMRSILALEGVDFKKHTAVISYFRENYIKSGKLENRISDIIGDLFWLRNKSDYEDFFVVSKKEVAAQVENAEYFLGQIKAYLGK